jgi:hypothetical protein
MSTDPVTGWPSPQKLKQFEDDLRALFLSNRPARRRTFALSCLHDRLHSGTGGDTLT